MLIRVKQALIDYALDNRIGFFSFWYDRVCYYLFYRHLYHYCFRRYGRGITWGRNGAYRCIPKSVRLNSYACIAFGDGVQIDEGVYIQSHPLCPGVVIEDGCRINAHVHIQAHGEIVIGKNTLIAPFAMLSTSDHQFTLDQPVMYQQQRASGQMLVGPGCWIGRNAQILGDVTLPAHSVVAAQAVVTKSFGRRVLLAGIPARVVREL